MKLKRSCKTIFFSPACCWGLVPSWFWVRASATQPPGAELSGFWKGYV